jgi:hypothetical protein
MNQFLEILNFILNSFISIWPYLLVTIPIAVAVQMSGASRYIRKAFDARPIPAIFLATLVGAFSPFCSCTVIPLVASLLIGGVPLAPVMSFWIASPSMDPEAFFLSVSMLGWELAVWRMAATLLLSLGAGFATHFIVRRGWFGEDYLRARHAPDVRSWAEIISDGWQALKEKGAALIQRKDQVLQPVEACCDAFSNVPSQSQPLVLISNPPVAYSSSGLASLEAEGCASGACNLNNTAATVATVKADARDDFWKRLLRESVDASSMVLKFMLLAFAIEALIHFYVPESWITAVMGGDNFWSVPLAALLGVPVYTSNLTALPLIGGLLNQGMSPGAALAFLIAGPTTTLPAMAAVWGLVSRRVFTVYVAISLVGAVFAGIAYQIF